MDTTRQTHANPWMNGFFIATETTKAHKPIKVDSLAVDRRLAIEAHQESIEARKQLAEWGLL